MSKNHFILFVALFFNCVNLFSQQTSDISKVMYVNTTSGLRGRAEPTVNSRVVTTLLHGQRIATTERSSTPVTIDGITDYWYKTFFWSKDTTWFDGDEMWLFGGYLSESLPIDAPVLLGKWHYSNDISSHEQSEGGDHYNFYADGSYRKDNPYDISHVGKWSLDGNIITIQFYDDYDWDSDKWGPSEFKIDRIQLTIENRNNINLIFQNGNVIKLARCNDPTVKN